MIGLQLQEGLRDHEREVRVLGAGLFDALVQRRLEQFPDAVAPGPDDHGAGGRTVVCHFGQGHHLLVPAGKVLCARSECALSHQGIVLVRLTGAFLVMASDQFDLGLGVVRVVARRHQQFLAVCLCFRLGRTVGRGQASFDTLGH